MSPLVINLVGGEQGKIVPDQGKKINPMQMSSLSPQEAIEIIGDVE